MRITPIVTVLLLVTASCIKDTPDPPGGQTDTLNDRVEDWLSEMTLEEKAAEMHGSLGLSVDGLWGAGGNERLGIPAFQMSDGPRGVTAGASSTFPVPMGRGASFDPELEYQVAEVMALELVAKGGNVLLAPVVEVLRHPAWGRAQETYGEDTHHLGVMGAAFVQGAQTHVVATPKHFALNSIEDTRFDVDVTIDERSLRELYLPPHRDVVDAGAGAMMSAYNSVNGDYCGENAPLIRDILKGEWGFEGVIMSDWIWGTHDILGMVEATLDIEMPAPRFYGEALVEAVESGAVDEAMVDDSVRRILSTKLRFGLDIPEQVEPAVVESAEHVALTLASALSSMVLLKNDGALPLETGLAVAVIGPQAVDANLGDVGSSAANPTHAVGPLEGIEAAAAHHGATVSLVVLPEDTATADAVIVVVGLTANDEGEQIPFFPGSDRETLLLHTADVELIQAVAAVNPRTVVVIQAGSAIVVDPWVDAVQGVVMAWYPGMQGGTAMGQLLFGDANFEGRLPLTIPHDEADLPLFDAESFAVTYDYWHGYRHLDHNDTEPRFAFGFGLSYTTWSYESLQATTSEAGVTLTVSVQNTGDRAGAEVVQAYFGTTDIPDRAPRDLRAFKKVWAQPGETVEVVLEVKHEDLAYWDDGWNGASNWTIEVGSDHRTLPLSTTIAIE
ncbi:MAG: glycosyl hydrolase [Rhodobacterales bacterium]|nr:glycosyl hydrolase [Rhodobacterales bacterium]